MVAEVDDEGLVVEDERVGFHVVPVHAWWAGGIPFFEFCGAVDFSGDEHAFVYEQ
ncbi:MAG: hypothetical protein M3Y91_10950 [Actinomycetota bacterium]|nr:hypothetical protein [Actinomycetota bacterium]